MARKTERHSERLRDIAAEEGFEEVLKEDVAIKAMPHEEKEAEPKARHSPKAKRAGASVIEIDNKGGCLAKRPAPTRLTKGGLTCVGTPIKAVKWGKTHVYICACGHDTLSPPAALKKALEQKLSKGKEA